MRKVDKKGPSPFVLLLTVVLTVLPVVPEAADAASGVASARVVYSCDEYTVTETEVAGEYDAVTPKYFLVDSGFYDGRAVVYGSGGYGYIDKTGRFAITPRYAKAYPFRDGIARVVEVTGAATDVVDIDGAATDTVKTTSYIDVSGNKVVDAEKIGNYYGFYLLDIFVLENGLLLENVDLSGIVKQNGAVFRDGLALTESGSASGGATAQAATWSGGNTPSYTPTSSHTTPRATAPDAESSRTLYGYIDENGNVIVPFDYEYGSTDFNENLALAKKDGKLYVLEKIPVVKLAADSPEVAGKRIPILMYHSVAEVPYTANSVLFVRPSELESQLGYLADNGFQTITFEDLDNIGAFSKPVLLTFDDGYKDSYTVLYPLLKKYNMKATVFMITDAVYSAEFISEDEIVEMSDSGLVSIQSHTVSHPYLTNVGNERLRSELSESKTYLEELTGKPVIALCYPTGKQNAAVRAAVADYYRYAVLMGGGQYVCGGNLLAMNRVYIKRGVSVASFAQLIK